MKDRNDGVSIEAPGWLTREFGWVRDVETEGLYGPWLKVVKTFDAREVAPELGQLPLSVAALCPAKATPTML